MAATPEDTTTVPRSSLAHPAVSSLHRGVVVIL